MEMNPIQSDGTRNETPATIEGIMHEGALLYVNRQCMAVTVLSKDCSEDAARQMIAQISSNVYMYARGEK